MQLISFCNSWILPARSKIVSRSSINFLLAIVSNVEPWNRFNSSISLRLFSWASRSSRFCYNNCSWRSCSSRRRCSSPFKSTINLTSLRLDNSIQFLDTCSVIIGLGLVFLNLCCRSRRILICSFSESRHGFSLTFEIGEPNSLTSIPVLTWPTHNDWLDNKLSSWEW